MDTKQNIYEMLTTDTGKHMLDSGGAYGRHHEKNTSKSLKDFEDEAGVEAHKDGMYTISVFHYLANQLMMDERCIEFNRLNVGCEKWDGELDLYGVCKKAEDYLCDNFENEIRKPFNSYNDESNLSQVIQGAYVELNGDFYVFLQIHQGCDVRGGYTDARLFKIDNDYGEFLAPEDVYGTFRGKEISNLYDGVRLRYEDNEEEIEVKRKLPELQLAIGGNII